MRGATRMDGYDRPDVFLRDLGRGGALGICYPTLYEVLDPREHQPLNAAEKRQMYERLEMLNRFNIKVLDMSREIFRQALDLWFDARQGRIPTRPDPELIDPIIAATSLVNSLRLYSANQKDFAPFVGLYPLDFVPVRVRKPGNYLSL